MFAALLFGVERLNHAMFSQYAQGVSGIFSIYSGFLIAYAMFSKIGWLPWVAGYGVAAQNLVFLGVDYSMDWKLQIAHKTGHAIPTAYGFALGLLAIKGFGY